MLKLNVEQQNNWFVWEVLRSFSEFPDRNLDRVGSDWKPLFFSPVAVLLPLLNELLVFINYCKKNKQTKKSNYKGVTPQPFAMERQTREACIGQVCAVLMYTKNFSLKHC